jgi:hypothetical protein
LPLYKKYYQDDERMQIIIDHNHHISNDSVVALCGLRPLEMIITLANRVKTTICKLLLSIPAQGHVTNKLFVQVAHQTGNDWLLCCFHTQVAAKVSVKLGGLEDNLKKYVREDSHADLAQEQHTLTFSEQVAPTKGHPKLPRLDVPPHI